MVVMTVGVPANVGSVDRWSVRPVALVAVFVQASRTEVGDCAVAVRPDGGVGGGGGAVVTVLENGETAVALGKPVAPLPTVWVAHTW